MLTRTWWLLVLAALSAALSRLCVHAYMYICILYIKGFLLSRWSSLSQLFRAFWTPSSSRPRSRLIDNKSGSYLLLAAMQLANELSSICTTYLYGLLFPQSSFSSFITFYHSRTRSKRRIGLGKAEVVDVLCRVALSCDGFPHLIHVLMYIVWHDPARAGVTTRLRCLRWDENGSAIR